MTYYKTTSWRMTIEQIEVERASDNSVWINGRRHAMASASDNYFQTFAEAKNFYIDKETRNVKGLEDRLADAKERLQEAQNL